MDTCGLTSLYDLFADFIVFRSLEALDPRLPRAATLRSEARLPAGTLPRKSDAAYARVIAHLVAAAQAIVHPGIPLAHLLYVGDTRLLDSTAFRSLRAATGWSGWGFIASEDLSAAPSLEREEDLLVSNRWGGLADFLALLRAQSVPLDSSTVLIVDLDKTAIGARGRNDRVIDQARMAAVYQTASAILGGQFPAARAIFDSAYARLNHPAHHPFTADNQDYLVYICLVVAAGLYDLADLLADLSSECLCTFEQFLTVIEGRLPATGTGLPAFHAEFVAAYYEGDPTPFKAFRRHEYRTTADRLGCLPPGAPACQVLAEEIAITQEVRDLALYLQAHGVLLFALTDKPDEAALPSPDMAALGYLPLHRIPTHVLGTPLFDVPGGARPPTPA
jgi:hypothetical protein